MKYILFFFFAFSSVFAQDYVGIYTKNIATSDGVIINYKLDLAADGTYEVSVFRNLGKSLSADENFYGKGNWKIENKLILFTCEELSDPLYINMNGTTSRFDAKNKKALRFFKSKSLWFKNPMLEKI